MQLPARKFGFAITTPRTIRRFHAAGVEVHAWTINDPTQMRELLDAGIDGLVTDRADLALSSCSSPAAPSWRPLPSVPITCECSENGRFPGIFTATLSLYLSWRYRPTRPGWASRRHVYVQRRGGHTMADRSLRGMRLGSQSLQSEEGVEFSPAEEGHVPHGRRHDLRGRVRRRRRGARDVGVPPHRPGGPPRRRRRRASSRSEQPRPRLPAPTGTCCSSAARAPSSKSCCRSASTYLRARRGEQKTQDGLSAVLGC